MPYGEWARHGMLSSIVACLEECSNEQIAAGQWSLTESLQHLADLLGKVTKTTLESVLLFLFFFSLFGIEDGSFQVLFVYFHYFPICLVLHMHWVERKYELFVHCFPSCCQFEKPLALMKTPRNIYISFLVKECYAVFVIKLTMWHYSNIHIREFLVNPSNQHKHTQWLEVIFSPQLPLLRVTNKQRGISETWCLMEGLPATGRIIPGYP